MKPFKKTRSTCFIRSKTTRLRLVVLNPIKHSCSFFEHYIKYRTIKSDEPLVATKITMKRKLFRRRKTQRRQFFARVSLSGFVDVISHNTNVTTPPKQNRGRNNDTAIKGNYAEIRRRNLRRMIKNYTFYLDCYIFPMSIEGWFHLFWAPLISIFPDRFFHDLFIRYLTLSSYFPDLKILK